MESAVGSGPPGSAGFASRINTGPPPPWGRDRVAGVFLGTAPWRALAWTWWGCGDVGASAGPIPHLWPLPFVRSRFQGHDGNTDAPGIHPATLDVPLLPSWEREHPPGSYGEKNQEPPPFSLFLSTFFCFFFF